MTFGENGLSDQGLLCNLHLEKFASYATRLPITAGPELEAVIFRFVFNV